MNRDYLTVNVTSANSYNPTPEHAGVVRMLNKMAIDQMQRDAEATIALWSCVPEPTEAWRLNLREYVNEIKKERENGQ